jgi:hypothetical protein
MISGNSDFSIKDDCLNQIPKNIKKWYGQNVLINDDRFIPIPMGIENKIECYRRGHGVGYTDRMKEKEYFLNKENNIIPHNNIYANFQIKTNIRIREPLYKICKEVNHITWDYPNLSYEMFYNNILNHKMILCPAGNGVDTHRLWEILYCGRVPITIKEGNFKIYELYKNYPIIILDTADELYDEDLIIHKYEDVVSKNYDKQLLYYSTWKNKILENSNI